MAGAAHQPGGFCGNARQALQPPCRQPLLRACGHSPLRRHWPRLASGLSGPSQHRTGCCQSRMQATRAGSHQPSGQFSLQAAGHRYRAQKTAKVVGAAAMQSGGSCALQPGEAKALPLQQPANRFACARKAPVDGLGKPPHRSACIGTHALPAPEASMPQTGAKNGRSVHHPDNDHLSRK